jgi:hypothetical protein
MNAKIPKSTSEQMTGANEVPSDARKPVTAREQAMLTIKLLVGAGLLIALFWIIDSALELLSVAKLKPRARANWQIGL